MATATFNYTGTLQSWVVPDDVTSIAFDISGAEGGLVDGALSSGKNDPPAAGSRLQGVLSVTPGETLYILVGGQGGDVTGTSSPGGTAGYGDLPATAGAVGGTKGGLATSGGGGGGGSSDIRKGGNGAANRVAVAAGAGGAANIFGGTGNTLDTQAIGASNPTAGANNTTLGAYGGGGGGGGWRGGDGGSANQPGAAGTCMYHTTYVTSPTATAAYRNGNGQVIFTYFKNVQISTDVVGDGAVSRGVMPITIARAAVGVGVATLARSANINKSFDLEGVGIASRILNPSIPRGIVGDGALAWARWVAAVRSLNVLGAGVVNRDPMIAVLIPRDVEGVGEVTATRSGNIYKSFALIGDGTVTEVHPVQANRSFDLAGEGYIVMTGSNASTITLPLDDLPTEGGGVVNVYRPLFIFDD